ncbi:MAG TPA: hypothetical protein PLK90_04220 [Clostridiales bacterium]|nr:hypothetical protein [Clostridiales bacterium]HQP69587.1 hypothetical protein [Clostridiales bacterium]
MNFRTIILSLLIISADNFSADFFSYYESFIKEMYQGKILSAEKTVKEKGWDRVSSLYKDIYELRLQKNVNKNDLECEAEKLIDDIEDGKIKDLSAYEKDLLTAVLYGSMAYIQSSDPSYSMFRNIKKSKKLFEKIQKKYNTKDSAFGSALSDISLVMYFENSFWVNSVLGYSGNITSGLKELDGIAFEGGITKTEANLFLIEYYAMILKDRRSSVKYSKNLCDLFPNSKYFKYLYAKDLYHTGKIMQALQIFRDINSDPGNEFYAYQYDAVIYEAQCLYITGSVQDAGEIEAYASKIHDGYILKKFRNEWKSTVKIRQEAIFRPQYYQNPNINLSDDEILRTCEVLFDHGFFREASNILDKIKNKDMQARILKFKTAVIMNDRKKAVQLYDSDEDIFEEDPDRLRLEIMYNIASADF